MIQDKPPNRPALIVSHAAHVLKLHEWIVRHRPIVHILTDGSGGQAQGPSAMDTLANDIERLGGKRGEVFACVSDPDLYQAILKTDRAFFTRIADTLAASLVENNVDFVVGDAHEGASPAHDLCRALTDAAVDLASRKRGRPVSSYACHQAEWMGEQPEVHDNSCIHLELNDREFERKLAATAHFPEWNAVVREALRTWGAITSASNVCGLSGITRRRLTQPSLSMRCSAKAGSHPANTGT